MASRISSCVGQMSFKKMSRPPVPLPMGSVVKSIVMRPARAKATTSGGDMRKLYDSKDEQSLYSTVADLLGEYRLVNPRITVQTVDYMRDPGLAQKVKAKYNLSAPTDKNLVIFDCEGKVKHGRGQPAGELRIEQVAKQTPTKETADSAANRRPFWARSPLPRPCWMSPAPGRSRPISSRATANTKSTAATK